MEFARALILMTPRTAARLGRSRERLARSARAAFARCEWVVADDPTRVHARICEFDPQVIIAAGGDGTVNLALQAMRPADALAVLPLGTANDLARGLGVARNPEHLGSFVLRSATTIDCLRVNGRRFCTTGGLGLPAEVAARVNALRNTGARRWPGWLGSRLYGLVAAQLCAGGPPRYRLDLAWEAPADGRPSQQRFVSHGLFVSNQASFARTLEVAPEADNADGQFELCVVLVRGRAALLCLLAHILGHRVGAHECRIIRARRAVIRADREVRFFGDGEVLADAREFEVELDPAALKLLS